MSVLYALFAVPWYWLCAGVLLMIGEALLPGVLLLWIGLGAVVVGIFVAIWPSAPLAVQLIVLAASMVLAVLYGVRYQARVSRKHTQNGLNTGLSAYVGRQVVVNESFVAGAGRIRVDDSFYNAKSSAVIHAGDTVLITQVEQGELIVVPHQI